MSDDFVVVATFGEQIEADLALSELDDAGIPCIIVNPATETAYNTAFPGTSIAVQIAVPQAEVEAARQILDATAPLDPDGTPVQEAHLIKSGRRGGPAKHRAHEE